MDTKQPEALRLEAEKNKRMAAKFGAEGFHFHVEPDTVIALLDRVVELEAQLEAIGAGGVEPVAAQSRFLTENGWGTCTLEHHLHVQANPAAWPGYETRALCAAPQPAAQAAPSDLMQWPLPCDVKVGHVTISKGCLLSTLVTRMQVLYEMGVDAPARIIRAAQAAPTEITLDFKMATELLEMFGGEPGLVTLQQGGERSHSGAGLYAFWSDMPEEGASFLGAEPDDEAFPDLSDAWSGPVPEPALAAAVSEPSKVNTAIAARMAARPE